jgi:uncharacterized membrane protein
MNKYLKESILWILILLPYAFLFSVWGALPGKVPTHFNIDGQADRWSDKDTLLFLPALIGVGVYLLMIIIPVLDPKKRIQEMGDKYFNLRFLLTLFSSVIFARPGL